MSEQNVWAKICMSFNKIKPYVAMISLQFGYAGMFIITLVSLKRGFSHWVLAVYRHAIATLVFAPFAYFLDKKTRPKMTTSIFLKIMVLAFLEPVLDQNLYYVGVQYASATFAAATTNVLPAVTFIMAVIFRMEKLNLKRTPSLAKVIGTLITVCGAMVMTLYTGPIIDIFWYSHGSNHHKDGGSASANQHWATGTIMLLSCIVGWSGFFILQNNTLKDYPAGLSLTTLICLMGTLEGGVVAVIMERQKRAWVVGFDSRLLAAAYSGIICSGFAYYLQAVVNKVRGPVFVTAFSPLTMIITAVLGAIVLSEKIHLGRVDDTKSVCYCHLKNCSLIGAVVIIVGLYSVVWGKSKENSESDSKESSACEDEKAHELPVVAHKKTPNHFHDKNSSQLEDHEKACTV